MEVNDQLHSLYPKRKSCRYAWCRKLGGPRSGMRKVAKSGKEVGRIVEEKVKTKSSGKSERRLTVGTEKEHTRYPEFSRSSF
jgi:hypothetical protein